MSDIIPLSSVDGVVFEQACALADIKMIVDERGASIIINVIDESNITRDKYGSIKLRGSNTLTVNAYPITFAPTEEQKSNGGLREDTDVMVHTAMLDWINAGYDIDDIDTVRGEVFVSGDVYEIREKAKISQFGNTFLYIVLGLNKK